jgi:hypothetical protein
MKITINFAKASRLPMGTVFITDDYTLPEDGHLHLNDNFIPMFFEDSIQPLIVPAEGITEDQVAKIDYLIDWMITDEAYGLDKAKDFANQFKAYGYTGDLEAKEKAAAEALASGIIPEGANMRRVIAGTYPCPKPEDIGFYIDPELWHLLIRNALRGISTLLIGPTGCGKTEIMKHIVSALRRDLSIVDMGTVQDAQSALIGVHRLNDKGVSIFDPAPLVKYIQQEQNIILLDEINR